MDTAGCDDTHRKCPKSGSSEIKASQSPLIRDMGTASWNQSAVIGQSHGFRATTAANHDWSLI